MSGCTCETYGHCHVCRYHADTSTYTNDLCNRGAHSFAEVSSTGWEMCEFCGARRHPERLAAAQQRKIDARRKPARWRVQFSVEVEADNIQHAKNIVPFELRKIPRLEFDKIVLTQKIQNK